MAAHTVDTASPCSAFSPVSSLKEAGETGRIVIPWVVTPLWTACSPLWPFLVANCISLPAPGTISSDPIQHGALPRCWEVGWIMRWTWILPRGQCPGHRFMALIMKSLHDGGKADPGPGLRGACAPEGNITMIDHQIDVPSQDIFSGLPCPHSY